jgi:pimeloyl-ACP methyl ester carboxylesterase
VLLLRGMFDAPYSLRGLAQRLHTAGAWVLGLWFPGHGTAPSGLVEVRWEDMAAALQPAMHNLRKKVGDQPVYLVGYSNGGALAVHYALSALEDPMLARVDRLVLISPAIGVTPLAALAVWQARLGHMLGLDTLAWTAIRPEYDPFKYGSFTVNAGDQTYRLTTETQSRLEAARNAGRLEDFPPVLAFQSAVDATVSTRALVQGLFARLPRSEHELVLFDINRLSEVERVLVADPEADFEAMFVTPDVAFSLSLVTNDKGNSRQVIVRRRLSGDGEITETRLALVWPRGLYSLSHVALPFSEDDPVYGAAAPRESTSDALCCAASEMCCRYRPPRYGGFDGIPSTPMSRPVCSNFSA